MSLLNVTFLDAVTRCVIREMPHCLIIRGLIRCMSNSCVKRTCVTKQKQQTYPWKVFSTCTSVYSPQRPVCSPSRLCSDTDRSENFSLNRGYSWLSNSLHSKGATDDSNAPLKMRYVFVTCCEDMWEEVPRGLKFDVAYLDSHPEAPYTTSTPVVMGIHGAPGSHKDLIPILQPMVEQGYRVIIPNLPGYRLTEGTSVGHDDCFSHSPDEYASFLAGFLTVIGIPRVDLLVGHSAGCYALLELCSEYKGVQSAMLINPAPHKPYRGIEPLWLLQILNSWWDKPMLRPLLKSVIYAGSLVWGFRKVPPSHLAISIRACVNVDFDDVIHNLVAIKEKQLPVCVVFSDNDRRIHLSQFMEYYKLVGGTSENLETFTSDVSDACQATTSYPRGVLLKDGGHYPLKRYHNVLTSEQQKLLKYIGMSINR